MEDLCNRIEQFAFCLITEPYDRINGLETEILEHGLDYIIQLLQYELAEQVSPVVIHFTLKCLNKNLNPNSDPEIFTKILNIFSEIFPKLPNKIAVFIRKTLAICVLHIEIQGIPTLNPFIDSLQDPYAKLLFFAEYQLNLSYLVNSQYSFVYFFHYLTDFIPSYLNLFLSSFVLSPDNSCRDELIDLATYLRFDNLQMLSRSSKIEFNQEIYDNLIVPSIAESLQNVCEWICANYSLNIYKSDVQRQHIIVILTSFSYFLHYKQDQYIAAVEKVITVESQDIYFTCYEQIYDLLSKLFEFSAVSQIMIDYLFSMIQLALNDQSIPKINATLLLIYKIKSNVDQEEIDNVISQIFTYLIESFTNVEKVGESEMKDLAEIIVSIIYKNPLSLINFLLYNIPSIKSEVVITIFVYFVNELLSMILECEEMTDELLAIRTSLVSCASAFLETINSITSPQMLFLSQSLIKMIQTLSNFVTPQDTDGSYETLVSCVTQILQSVFEFVQSDFMNRFDPSAVYELIEQSCLLMEQFNIKISTEIPILNLPKDIISKMSKELPNVVSLASEVISSATQGLEKVYFKAAASIIAGFIEGKTDKAIQFNDFVALAINNGFPQYAVLMAMNNNELLLEIANAAFSQNGTNVPGSFIKNLCRACKYSKSTELVDLLCSHIDIQQTNPSPLKKLSSMLSKFLWGGSSPGDRTVSFIVNWIELIISGFSMTETSKDVLYCLRSLPHEVITSLSQDFVFNLFNYALEKSSDDTMFLDYFSDILVILFDEKPEIATQIVGQVCQFLIFGQNLIESTVSSFDPDRQFSVNKNNLKNVLIQISVAYRYSSKFI
ncbi:hypothetical protein TVAG_100120 [Trichomonas vaginalis G3]|uniref:Uncharacterized protein n=1 Tax=Trichomonas vaginalis (strain ATCC PRA-98 / G3) TaxID=412133 RepID=A2EK78_TRIV3|nr:armadillo (ARM) repeat-containing protein family [Trichomonas vaginalis G3]EAY06971.1 hypothetical protein TVAG_100120 [Trichomonas vaginalis G3]KAI5499120.1 armadillo (ARM) repeat-containing protein family [Trichomonas vaginalis G3]|eukprot:XP_001319194.1 hypothetical protein [Trichomonas vaginalis G3]